MDFTEQDIAILRQQGDLASFMGLISGFRATSGQDSTRKPCKHCGAQKGEKCTTPRGKRIESGVHASRMEGEEVDEERKPGQWPTK